MSTTATDVRQLRLHARYDEGHGQLIVMLHGINATAIDWRPVIDTIGPGYRCIAFDLLGYGESPRPLDIDYTADEHATVIENTLVDLGIAIPFLLAGYSLGGDIAVRYAATYPHRVRRLFLLAAPFYPPPERLTVRGFSAQMIQMMLMRWAWAFLARGQRDSTRFYAVASGRLKGFTEELMRTTDLTTSWDIMSRTLVNCISKATFVEDFPRLSMPTVFASGMRDAVVRPDLTSALQRVKPDLEIRRLVAADHMVLRTLPRRVGREILRDEIRRLSVSWRSGEGPPLAILVGAEDGRAWRPTAEVLAERFDVAIIDLLGFGGSPAPLHLRYDLGDHVAAVNLTLHELWPNAPSVQLAGFGLGATVALGCAAESARVHQVTAFSPACAFPGTIPREGPRSPNAAWVMAGYEQILAIERDGRARGVVGEALERCIVPLVRSLENTVLATDPSSVMARTRGRVTMVLPVDDADAPRDWARRLAQQSRIDLFEPAGRRDVIFTSPAAAVAVLEPSLAVRAAAIGGRSRLVPAGRMFADMVRSVDLRIIARGGVSLAAGAALLAPIPIGPSWIGRGLALWIAWSAISTILGAVALHRERNRTWITEGGRGAVGVMLAAWMLLDAGLAVGVSGAFVVIWLLWHGLSDLYVGWKVRSGPVPRGALWLQGTLALVLAVVAIRSPTMGMRVLRLTLGFYLVGSGTLLAGFGIRSWRRASRRVRELITRSRERTAASLADG